MTERDMAMDVLSGVKGSLANYAKIIAECANTNLRQTFQQMRNGDEQFQYNLYQIAAKKGYYTKAPMEAPSQCQDLKVALTKQMTTHQGAGPIPVLS